MKLARRILGTAIVLLLSFSVVFGATVTVQWDPNSESDLAGYELYMRMEGEQFDMDNPVAVVDKNTTTVEIPAIPNDGLKRIFAVLAFDISGNKSGLSNEAVADIPDDIPPNNPVGCSVTVQP